LELSLHQELTRDYFRTTAVRSARGVCATRDYYEHSATQLGRYLRPWLPVSHRAACLDLACGCGEALYLLEREGFTDVTGIDLCAEELDQVRTHVRAQLVCMDVLGYLKDCPDSSVDFVLALNFIEHLSKNLMMAVLSEVARVLRPGGTMVAMVPNAISPLSGLTRHWDLTHEWAFTPNNFYQLAALAGFANQVDFKEWGPRPHGVISTIRYILWQLVRAGIALRLMIEAGNTKGGVYTMDMLVRMHAPEQSTLVGQ
jgi:SAM-dependent methyltransferase